MFDFLKKKKNSDLDSAMGNKNSGDADVEAMKDEFFKYFNKAEEEGVLLGEENYQKAFEIARIWVTKEMTNRSFGCLAAAAFRLGTFDPEKLEIAHEIYKMLAEKLPEYKEQLKTTEELMKIQEDGKERIRNILKEKSGSVTSTDNKKDLFEL